MFQCQQRAADEASAVDLPASETLRPCPVCRGVLPAREMCGTCGGLGAVEKPDPRRTRPRGLELVLEVLAARAGIERYGLEGWMTLAGIGELHPLVPLAISVFEARLARWEHWDKCREARRARRKP